MDKNYYINPVYHLSMLVIELLDMIVIYLFVVHKEVVPCIHLIHVLKIVFQKYPPYLMYVIIL